MKRIWAWVKWNVFGGRRRAYHAWQRMALEQLPSSPHVLPEIAPADIGKPAGVPSPESLQKRRDQDHDKLLNMWLGDGGN